MDHINKFKPCITHYRRHNAPNMRYLSRALTVQSMFDDFEREHPGFCKIELYRKTIKLMHISLCMPKSNVCVECETHKNKSQAKDVDELTVLNFEEWKSHKNKGEKATDKYHEDAMIPNNQNVRIYSMDLQKVILIPNMPSVKDSNFLSRLTAFNLTFASIKKKSSFKNYCSMWHEGLAGRDGNHIVDAFFRVFEEERDVKEFIIWSDNCTGQNKNWVLYTSLVWLVNQGNGPDCVTFRYLTKGHTHMSADGIHGNIETKINKIGNIYDYNDLTAAWEKKKRQVRKNAKVSDSMRGYLLNPIVEVCFKKGKRSLDYKTDFDQEEFISLDFCRRNSIFRAFQNFNQYVEY
ncbi:hypothetical protein JTB14_035147 [Gonioctena quinquepunctata]|nr:hypothetical protein JTB14_035147 [Gonioctena quinquepunctata]